MPRPLLLMLALVLALGVNRPVPAAGQSLDDTPRTVVMSASSHEWKTLLAATAGRTDHLLDGKLFVTGRLAGRDVLLVLSGVSMVNAAMTTQKAIDRFNVKAVVFSGIAGGVDPSLDIGDVIVPDQWGQYLESVFAREVDGRFVPLRANRAKNRYPNFGMMFPRATEVTRTGLDSPELRFWFPADARLLEVARRIAGRVVLDRCTPEGRCLTLTPKVVVGGNGVSGQSFVDNAAFRTYTRDTFRAVVLDMESAAVAHVAFSQGVPFIAFRSLSDLAGGGAGENQMGTFFALAAENSARVVRTFLAEMP